MTKSENYLEINRNNDIENKNRKRRTKRKYRKTLLKKTKTKKLQARKLKNKRGQVSWGQRSDQDRKGQGRSGQACYNAEQNNTPRKLKEENRRWKTLNYIDGWGEGMGKKQEEEDWE